MSNLLKFNFIYHFFKVKNWCKTTKITFYKDSIQTLGNICEACGEDCKNVSKGFNSLESSFNELSAALRAALQA